MYKPSDIDYWLRVVIVGAVALVGLFDLLLLYRYGPRGTISVVLRNLSYEFPILPYLIAFGMGAFLYHIIYR